MTRAEFLAAIARETISPRSFSLDRDETEAYVAKPEGVGWEVYYSERGQRGDPHAFAAEGPALDFLLDWLRKDHTTRVRH